MEMACEGCSNAAKRVLAKIGGTESIPTYILCQLHDFVVFIKNILDDILYKYCFEVEEYDYYGILY